MRSSILRVPLAWAAVAAGSVSGAIAVPAAHAGSASSAGTSGKNGVLLISRSDYSGEVNADGTGQHQFKPTDGSYVWSGRPAWSPDGRRVAYSPSQNAIEMTDADGSHPLVLTVKTLTWEGMAFTSDGANIVYAPMNEHLLSIPVNGSAADGTPIVTGPAGSCLMAPSIVGDKLLYTMQGTTANPCNGPDSVWIHDLKSGTDTKIADNMGAADLSPDGTQVAFTQKDAAGNDQIFTINVDGTGLKQITTVGNSYNPAWSPDGALIAYAHDEPNAAVPGTFLSGTFATRLSDLSAHKLSDYTGDVSWQPAPVGPPPATPPSGTSGTVAERRGSAIVVSARGAGDRTLATDAVSGPDWSPNGQRLVYTGAQGVTTMTSSGGAPIVASAKYGAQSSDPVFDPSGSTIYFTATTTYDHEYGRIVAVSSDGTMRDADPSPITSPGNAPGDYESDGHPNSGPDGSLLFDRRTYGFSGQPTRYDVYRLQGRGTPVKLIADASEPAYSPDGRQIAFIRKDADGVEQVFRVAADGVSGLTQISHNTVGAARPRWSADGSQISYSLGGTASDAPGTPTQIVQASAANGSFTGSLAGQQAVWQPAPGQVHVVRQWGADRVGTAIAASRYTFADHGAADPGRSQAGAVVLTRSDQYADALTGSALAVRKNAPLLITSPTALQPAVEAEIGRVLKPGGTVYVLGGTAALSPAVSNRLAALHYHVQRLAGADRFTTALSVDQVIDPNPRIVLIATGTNFKDALAAGASGEPLVLTGGAQMPASSAKYLDHLDPNAVQLVTVGGPGDKALVSGYQAGMMPHWPGQISRLPLVGATAPDTAVMFAQSFTWANNEAAFATTAGWADALSGGAMVGHRGGPLLLTDPNHLFGPAAAYLAGQDASLWTVDMLGGPAALSDSLIGQIGSLIGSSGYVSFPSAAPAALPTLKASAAQRTATLDRSPNAG